MPGCSKHCQPLPLEYPTAPPKTPRVILIPVVITGEYFSVFCKMSTTSDCRKLFSLLEIEAYNPGKQYSYERTSSWLPIRWTSPEAFYRTQNSSNLKAFLNQRAL